jgi:hypothetical protein
MFAIDPRSAGANGLIPPGSDVVVVDPPDPAVVALVAAVVSFPVPGPAVVEASIQGAAVGASVGAKVVVVVVVEVVVVGLQRQLASSQI